MNNESVNNEKVKNVDIVEATNHKQTKREFIPKQNKNTKKNKTFFQYWGGTIITAIFCVCIIVGGRMAHVVRVVGSSMYPTYSNGNILVTKLNDTSTKDDIIFGDIVVCSLKERGDSVQNSEKRLIKRVVGMPGDTLQVLDGKLYRNDKLLDESFPTIKEAGILKTKLILKEDEYFVMGDNRNNSYDCRMFGPIKENEITNIVKFKIF